MIRSTFFNGSDEAIYPQDKPLSLLAEERLSPVRSPAMPGRQRYGRITVNDGRYLCLRDKAREFSRFERSYRFFQGHYDYSSILQYIPDDPKVIIFLRDPFDRLVSNYYYHRSFRWSWIDATSSVAMAAAKASASISAFLDCPSLHVRHLNHNHMVRQICGMEAFDSRFDPILDWEEIYDRAVEHLENVWHVGFLECFAESARGLCRKFGLPTDAVDVPFVNSRQQNAEFVDTHHMYEDRYEEVRLTDEDREKMESFIELDRRLYEHARRRFWPADAAAPATAG